MTKADLVEKVADEAEMTQKDAEQLVEIIFDSIIGTLNKGEKIEIPTIDEGDEIVSHVRFPIDMMPLESRKDSFDEVVLGYHRLNAIAEAMRCLHCDRR
jgi:hypothetical protein